MLCEWRSPNRRGARAAAGAQTDRLHAGGLHRAHFARGTVELECLRQAGFFRLPNRGMTFAVRPLAELPVNPAAPEAWDMTLGDLEVF